jgi:hypothetical protein
LHSLEHRVTSYALFALRAKSMAVSPALRAAETAIRKHRCFAKRIDNFLTLVTDWNF